MRKIFNILFIFIFLTILTACKRDPVPQIPDECNRVFPAEFIDFIGNRPVYITSLGQSKDIENLVIRLQHYKIGNFSLQFFLDLDTVLDNSVVFLVVGASIKGLGDSGTSIEEEIKRVNELNQIKDQRNLSVITFHIGGVSRRGETSDRLIKEAFLVSDLAIYLEEGNYDGFLCNLGENNTIPYVGCPSTLELDNAILLLYNLKTLDGQEEE